MPRIVCTPLLVVALMLLFGVAWAQVGTPNLAAATPWQGDDAFRVEGRFFQEDNQTWGVFYRGAISDDADGMFGYLDWETVGEDPIAGALRQTDYEAVVFDLKWLILDGSPRVALRAGADLLLASRGTNLELMASAWSRGPIPAVSLPIEWGMNEDILLLFEPKIVWFDDELPVTGGGTIPGFGEVVMIGGGFRWTVAGDTDLVADAAYPVSESNTINEETNALDEDVVWSAGISHRLDGDWTIDVFATNAAGPTMPTSAIAAPDQSVGVGVCVGGSW